MGRNVFVHVPAAGLDAFMKETFSKDGIRAALNLTPLYMIFVPVFWAIFDQTGSAWVLQAEQMDPYLGEHVVLPSQVQAINPLLILIGIPLFTYVVYPMGDKIWKLTPLRKVGIGFVFTAAAFALSAIIETKITAQSAQVIQSMWASLDAEAIAAHPMPTKMTEAVRIVKELGWSPADIAPYLTEMPHISWQVIAYIILTAGEILVSIVCLEFAYTQSPRKMKSFIMGIYMLGISLGNFYVAGVNMFMDASRDEAGNTPLDGANYYWFFSGLMIVTTIIYVIYAQFYKGKTYIQGEDEEEAIEAQAEAEGTETR
jgi:POT family proton-dependent oligopeptide transporter